MFDTKNIYLKNNNIDNVKYKNMRCNQNGLNFRWN